MELSLVTLTSSHLLLAGMVNIPEKCWHRLNLAQSAAVWMYSPTEVTSVKLEVVQFKS